MKGIVIVGVLFFAAAAFAAPLDAQVEVEIEAEIPQIEIEAEVPQVEKKQRRWELIPDGNGQMHLVDINAIEAEPEPHFDAMNDVFFVLFTRRNRNAGQRLARTTASINGSQWSSGQGFRFIIHEWNNHHGSPVNIGITNALLDRLDHNVVRVDWGAGANSNYVTSRNRVPEVASAIASFIDWLHLNNFLTFSRTHIIGHSLGGHIAGLTGKRVTRGRIQQIFGMDPAGPLFDMGNAAARLAPGDAVYTEMLATNAGVLGFDQPIAAANFYPNWGTSQPGCGVDLAGTCAHGRAFEFYAESINRNMFAARRCANYGQITSRNCPTGQGGGSNMGNDLAKSVTGIFFLETNAGAPFSRG